MAVTREEGLKTSYPWYDSFCMFMCAGKILNYFLLNAEMVYKNCPDIFSLQCCSQTDRDFFSF